jgi:hypothetical protein
LLVVASGDLEDVALELVSNTVTWNFGTHTPTIVLELDALLINRKDYRTSP